MLEDTTVLLVGDVPGGLGGCERPADTLAVDAVADLSDASGRAPPPDVVLVPGEDVEAAADRLDAPVVAATDDPSAALSVGADECVPSDAPAELVCHRVRAVAERRRRRERALLADPLSSVLFLDAEGRVRDVGMVTDVDAPIEPPSRRLRTIVENLPIVLFALDDEGTFTLSEGRGLGQLGLEPGEVVGRSAFDVYSANEGITSAIERALDGERVTHVHEVGDLAFETWYQPLVEDGTVRSVLGAAIDVTEQVAHERQLKQHETIVETVPDGVFVLDETGTILGGNETAARMVGSDYDALVGEQFTRLVADGVVDESVVDRYDEVVRQLLSAGSDSEKGRLEFEVRPPGGGERIVEVHVALRPHDEQFRGTIGVLRDVTARRERERQLERQNERLDEFASVVSHDLRNPLSVARGTADLLADDVDAPELDQIRSSLERMDALIETLLELARSGQTVTEPTAVDLGALTATAWATVSATDAGLVVRTDAVVEADRSRLRQLLENLFRNAVEHGSASPGSPAREDAEEHSSESPRSQAREEAEEHAGGGPRIEVGSLEAGNGFYVADDGPGVPPDERERVFEHGYSTESDGTGIGLAIVRSIAEAHGWEPRLVESEAGGARFEFHGVVSAE